MPELLSDDKKMNDLIKIYSSDAVRRAKKILRFCPSIGAYSGSNGIREVREAVARFIEKRDNFPSNPDHIFLTNGASEGIARVLNFIVSSPNTGILVPIPQYPLYTATLAMLNAKPVFYYLDEKNDWKLSKKELIRAVKGAKDLGIDVRALVIINPGNPTGSCFDRKTLQDIIRVCMDEGLVLLADEVYQENIYYDNYQFHSAKKILLE